MTLLLGPPSSGKTTLLLALAGKLHPSLKVRFTRLLHDPCKDNILSIHLFWQLDVWASLRTSTNSDVLKEMIGHNSQ